MLVDAIQNSHLLRSKRLNQIASLVMGALSLLVPFFWFEGQLQVVYPLIGGVGMMLICLVLNRIKHTDLANMTLLTSMFGMTSLLMWNGGGINDVALLSYPVILIMAGLLTNKRAFWSLTILMFLFVLLVAYATDNGWRNDAHSEYIWAVARDVLIILTVCSISVWLIVNDLHTSLKYLKSKIVTVQREHEHFEYASQHDLLTGLSNRALGREHITHAIAQAQRNGTIVALLFVDLDNFKLINDSLGHHAGDEFLKVIAERLQASIRRSDIVSRHGGDEFIIGLFELDTVTDIAKIASNVLKALAAPIQIETHELLSSCSIGISVFPNDGLEYEELLRQADIAMYQSKEAGRNMYTFFDTSMNTKIQQHLLLLTDLKSALANKEFELHYQPVVNLRTQKIVGAEALIRWRHPKKGMIPPGEFIEAAEKSGLIVDIGDWVIEEGCNQLMRWRKEYRGSFFLAVNLSPLQFRRGNIDKVVLNHLDRCGIPPHYLELEITESTLVNDDNTFLTTFSNLKDKGVKISIDDFGTGYSNLSYLQQFQVNKLKIDQSFIKNLEKTPQNRSLVHAIIQLANSLSLVTTAEGIEDEHSRLELIDLGCVQGQGYLFSKPIPPEQFFTLLTTQTKS